MKELFDWFIDILVILQSAMPSTVSPLELFWTIPLALGWHRFVRRWIASDRARIKLRRANMGQSIDIISTKRWIMHGFLTVAFEFGTAVGIISMLVPQSPAQNLEGEYALLGILSAAGLLGMGFTLVLMGEDMDSRTRSLYRYYSRPPQAQDRRKSDRERGSKAPGSDADYQG